MWTVLIFLNIGILHTVSSSPPCPVNVTFSSVNLRNVLQWFPGNATQGDTHYTVQYAIYGDSVPGGKGKRVHWRPVRLCTEIVRNWCDLTNETWDLEHGYYARVRAVGKKAASKWALTQKRFDPKIDTDFGPPLVSVEIEDNSAIITMKGPMRYLPNNQTPAVPMATVYPHMTYNLSVLNTFSSQTRHFPVVSNVYKYRAMDYSTEYCFSAKARFIAMPAHCLPSAWHCITTPEDPVITQLKRIVVGIVVPSVCICFLVVPGYVLYHYLTGQGQKSPYTLNPPSFHPPPLTLFPDNLNIILMTVITDEPPADTSRGKSDPASIRQPLPNPDPPLGYARQRPDTPPPPEEAWDDLPVDYGFIGVNPEGIVGGEEENMEWKSEGGEDGADMNAGRHEIDAAKHSYNKKEWEVKDEVCAGANASRTGNKAYVPAHTHTQTVESSTLVRAHAWSPMNPVLLNQTQPSVRPQGANTGATDREKEYRECPGLFLNKNPQTGLFDFALNVQPISEGSTGDEALGKMRGGTDGGEEGGGESEKVALLSAYASQNIGAAPVPRRDQLDLLPCDYHVLRLATGQEVEGEGTICINWDPATRKIVFPEVDISEEAELDRPMQGEVKMGKLLGGEEEEGKETKGELRLENVIVRQVSEAETEVQIGRETGEEDEIMTKWNLVISMDQ